MLSSSQALNPTAPSFNPPKSKTPINITVKRKPGDVINVFTGYNPTSESAIIYDIIVYDIPAAWDQYRLLQELRSWGTIISLKTKKQHKYQTVTVKLEQNSGYAPYVDHWTTRLDDTIVRIFPANWSLRERQERARFQAVCYNFPASITPDDLYTPKRNSIQR